MDRKGGEGRSEPKLVTTAVIVTLVAGILIILGSSYAGSLYVTFEGLEMIIGIVSGVHVFIFAFMLKIRPGEDEQGLRVCCFWRGSLVLVFSIDSLLAGSFVGLIGSLLGIVGGLLAILQGALSKS